MVLRIAVSSTSHRFSCTDNSQDLLMASLLRKSFCFDSDSTVSLKCSDSFFNNL